MSALNRPSWHEIFMEVCETMAKRSTCCRLQTGAVIVKNNNIISTGYNGVPTNQLHCYEYWLINHKQMTSESFSEFIASDEFKKLHHEWSLNNENHAEMNAICQAEHSLKGTELYTKYSPCIQCAKVIASAGISVVYYKYEYTRNLQESSNFLDRSNIKVFKI